MLLEAPPLDFARPFEDEWPISESLPTDLPPVEPFLPELLPDTCRPWVVDISERMQCPLDLSAISVVICLASILGRQVAIRPKRLDDWTVVPNLWGAVVGRPSILKTPAISEPKKEVDALEAQSKIEFDHAEKEYRAAELTADASMKERTI